jgi:hypothetical protein
MITLLPTTMMGIDRKAAIGRVKPTVTATRIAEPFSGVTPTRAGAASRPQSKPMATMYPAESRITRWDFSFLVRCRLVAIQKPISRRRIPASGRSTGRRFAVLPSSQEAGDDRSSGGDVGGKQEGGAVRQRAYALNADPLVGLVVRREQVDQQQIRERKRRYRLRAAADAGKPPFPHPHNPPHMPGTGESLRKV